MPLITAASGMGGAQLGLGGLGELRHHLSPAACEELEPWITAQEERLKQEGAAARRLINHIVENHWRG